MNRAPKWIASLPTSLFQSLRRDPSIFCQRCRLLEWEIHAIVKKYAYQARLEDATAHTLRHSFAKILVDAGTPLDQVATLLGHESLDTTRISHSQVNMILSGLYDVPLERLFEKMIKPSVSAIFP